MQESTAFSGGDYPREIAVLRDNVLRQTSSTHYHNHAFNHYLLPISLADLGVFSGGLLGASGLCAGKGIQIMKVITDKDQKQFKQSVHALTPKRLQ